MKRKVLRSIECDVHRRNSDRSAFLCSLLVAEDATRRCEKRERFVMGALSFLGALAVIGIMIAGGIWIANNVHFGQNDKGEE